MKVSASVSSDLHQEGNERRAQQSSWLKNKQFVFHFITTGSLFQSLPTGLSKSFLSHIYSALLQSSLYCILGRVPFF